MSEEGKSVLPLSRRTLLAAATAALVARLRPAWSAEALPVTIFVPFGPRSTVATAVELVRESATASLGATAAVVYPRRPHPMQQSLAALAEPGPEAVPLLATDVLAHVMLDRQRAGQGRPKTLDPLTPVCKLTTGYSTTLFVSSNASTRNWDDFAQLAQRSPLTVADANGSSIHLRFLKLGLGTALSYLRTWTGEEVFDAVLRRRVHAGLIDTLSLLAFDRENPGKALPLLTFGGERNAVLDVPTLREVSGDRRLATTNSVALFGPPSLDPATVTLLHHAFSLAAADPSAKARAAALDFPLAVEGPEVVLQTIERDLKVLETGGL